MRIAILCTQDLRCFRGAWENSTRLLKRCAPHFRDTLKPADQKQFHADLSEATEPPFNFKRRPFSSGSGSASRPSPTRPSGDFGFAEINTGGYSIR